MRSYDGGLFFRAQRSRSSKLALPFTLEFLAANRPAGARLLPSKKENEFRKGLGMNDSVLLRFPRSEGQHLQLPEECGLFLTGYEADSEVRQALGIALERIVYALGFVGMDLRALDGITLARDCRKAAMALQRLPEGQAPLEMGEQPDTLEMARTVAVWREKELRFHIVLRAGLGLMTLSPEKDQQELADACIAHEAAHVEHEGHLFRTFPDIYGRPLPCGDRSRLAFVKAMDVWSEYAACRSSAMFRPEAVEEFEGMFCRAFEDSLAVCKERIAAFRRDPNALEIAREIQQIFGDVFVCAGYFLGHVEGTELDLKDDASRVSALLKQYPPMEELFTRLRCELQELWLTECAWKSIDVFAPVYDLICEMMALHGLAFARHEEEWHMVVTDDHRER